jgi:RNA polymerase II subunit A small phosphatase-like protein
MRGINHYLKPLASVKRLGWDLERVLIDTPEKCVRNYGNAISGAISR